MKIVIYLFAIVLYSTTLQAEGFMESIEKFYKKLTSKFKESLNSNKEPELRDSTLDNAKVVKSVKPFVSDIASHTQPLDVLENPNKGATEEFADATVADNNVSSVLEEEADKERIQTDPLINPKVIDDPIDHGIFEHGEEVFNPALDPSFSPNSPFGNLSDTGITTT